MKTKIWSMVAILVLLIAGIAYTQTSIQEIEGILQFRNSAPQMRAVNKISVLDLAGTSAQGFSAARNAIVTTGTTVTRTLLASECGSVIIDNGTSSTQTYTLPAITNAGCQFTFIAGDAGGEILINSAASATCVITTLTSVGTDIDSAISTDTTCNTGLKNTAATNAIGDSLTIVSDATRWLGVGITSGIWTQQ